MILPDVNLLIYAHDSQCAMHQAAKEWWAKLMTDRMALGIPWAISLGFIRLTTHGSVFVRPLSTDAAVDIVKSWLTRTHVSVLHPGSEHLGILRRLLNEAGVGGNIATDAHLAALAIEHQCELNSNDSDFSRFPGLRWRNPL